MQGTKQGCAPPSCPGKKKQLQRDQSDKQGSLFTTMGQVDQAVNPKPNEGFWIRLAAYCLCNALDSALINCKKMGSFTLCCLFLKRHSVPLEWRKKSTVILEHPQHERHVGFTLLYPFSNNGIVETPKLRGTRYLHRDPNAFNSNPPPPKKRLNGWRQFAVSKEKRAIRTHCMFQGIPIGKARY